MNDNIPQDLLDYLKRLISPPEGWLVQQGREDTTLVALDLDGVDWTSIPDGTYTGAIARGEPTEEQVAHLWRVVRPGAHVVLIAPEHRKTGHVGACALEDGGFEIRDAILVANEPGDGDHLHYVPKANSKERNAGCEHLASKRTASATCFLLDDLDEEEIGEIEAALLEAGVPEEVVENLSEAGLPKDQIPAGLRDRFKKPSKGPKYGNSHPCLAPEALVMTDKGYRRIDEIQIGGKVYCSDGRFHRVRHVSRHPYTSRDLFEIAVMGTNVTTLASDNHPFLIWRPHRDRKGNIVGGAVQWTEAKDIQKGDYTMTPLLAEALEQAPAGARESEPEFWFMFGLYLAEGSVQTAGHGINVYPSYTLGAHEDDLIERVRRYFEPTATSVGRYKKPEGEAYQVIPFDSEAGALFLELGGKGAAGKSIDPCVWNLPQAHRRALVEGYLAGDGGQVREHQQSKSVSRDLSSQIALLAESLGYKSNIHREKGKPGKIGDRQFKRTADIYQVHIYSKNQMPNRSRKPSKPTYVEYEGITYLVRYVKGVEPVPYVGDVVNLSVQGSPTFMTAVGMSHNTVKPKEVLKRLLSDVPSDAVILDTFMGSGSMGLACIETGHDYIGIEREAEYIEIADARIRHHAAAKASWVERTIVSDAPQSTDTSAEIDPEEGSALDLFGG